MTTNNETKAPITVQLLQEAITHWQVVDLTTNRNELDKKGFEISDARESRKQSRTKLMDLMMKN